LELSSPDVGEAFLPLGRTLNSSLSNLENVNTHLINFMLVILFYLLLLLLFFAERVVS
jgi:hypothetical protein